ncbi:hypothetical protein [Nocardia heshunensis]
MVYDGRVPRQLPQRNRNHVDREEILTDAAVRARSTAGNSTVVFTGLHGIGKSHTAIEFAHRLAGEYPDGQLLCTLPDGPQGDSQFSDVIAQLLQGLGDRPEDIPDRRDALLGRYHTRTAELRLLIVIDNVKTKAQIRSLCPADGASLLVVAGAGAATDLNGKGVVVCELDQLTDDDANELLGRLVGFDRIAAEPEAAHRILRLCGNVPRAVEIAAGMLAAHPNRAVATVAELLSDEGRRSQQLSLPEIFGTAYDAVSELAQQCYRVFGLHGHDGWLHVDAVVAAVGVARGETLCALVELANLHLVTERDGGFQAIDLMRVHARTVPVLGGERERAELALLTYFGRRLRAADVVLAPARPWRRLLLVENDSGAGEFADAGAARTWVARELPNLVAAALHAETAGEPEYLVHWCVLLWSFHEKDKHLDTMRALHLRAIPAAHRAGEHALASLLLAQMGFLHYWLRELSEATAHFEQAAQLAAALEPSEAARQLEASAVEGLGLALLARNDVAAARDAMRRNYQLARALGDPRRIALAALHGGKAEDPAAALRLFDEAAGLFGDLDSDETENLAKVALWRGRKLVALGDLDTARTEFDAAETVMRERGRPFDEAEILVSRAELAARAGGREEAGELYRQARSRYEALCFAESVAAVDAALAALG